MLSEGLEIEISHFEAENVTLKGNYLWQVVEIVIGGDPTVLDSLRIVLCACLCLSAENCCKARY